MTTQTLNPMLLQRDISGQLIEPILAHPEVAKWVFQPGQAVADVLPLCKDQRNVVLVDPQRVCAVVFHFIGSGRYIVHTLAQPSARGGYTLRVVRSALHFMFTKTDAEELFSFVPERNLAALGLVRLISGKKLFSREAAWTMQSGTSVSVSYWRLGWLEWALSCSYVKHSGEWFHEELERKCEAAGLALEQHLDDPTHDGVVGATVDAIHAGMVDKALALYNRWALLSGYAPMQLAQRSPLVLDIQSCFLAIRSDGEFEVLAKQRAAAA